MGVFLWGENMTDKEAKEFYNSEEWKHKRLAILRRDQYECQDCRKRLQEAKEKDIRLSAMDAKIRRATQVHHIMELKEHPELALDEENLVSLCTQCHNVRHGRHVERKFVPKRRVIAPEQW